MSERAQRFLILCDRRTGSTWLRLMLNSHPYVVCHGEVLARAKIMGLERIKGVHPPRKELEQQREADVAGFLYDVVFAREHEDQVIGAKIMYDQLEQSDEHLQLRQRLMDDKALRIIHLRRENHLKRIISAHLSSMMKRSHLPSDEEKPEVPKIYLDFERSLRNIKRTEKFQQQYAEMFQDHPLFDLSYEALVAQKATLVPQMQSFLGVDPVPLQEELQKIAKDDLREMIENYDELKDKFAQTPYAHLFEM